MPAINIHSVYRNPLSKHFRSRRMRKFQQDFQLSEQTTVLDVGGTLANWTLLPIRPDLTILNLPHREIESGVKWIQGDGRQLPCDDASFDLVYSNSVIEHLSTKRDQERLASEIARVGQGYYVQTPNKWFPIEPHYLTPFIHWVPKPLRLRLLRFGTVWGWLTKASPEHCKAMIDEIRLLDEREMCTMFPDAKMEKEKVLGLTKSIVAIRHKLPTSSVPAAQD